MALGKQSILHDDPSVGISRKPTKVLQYADPRSSWFVVHARMLMIAEQNHEKRSVLKRKLEPFFHLALTCPFDDESLKSMFWIGVNFHRPVDLPDTTDLNWREAHHQVRLMMSVRPRSRTLPDPEPESPPCTRACPSADGELPPITTRQPEPEKKMPGLILSRKWSSIMRLAD
ncbi:hypothetical protein DPX16_5373 [Anabarilius grahami]|uniref:Uncharacterized protein n=1 Tax=Anabarilius grahami TaxID=495550 RepID=A0A3N0Y584_ANAGA|nr:hypothetical protein DPX16_5373 [Anabarilius grahami]